MGLCLYHGNNTFTNVISYSYNLGEVIGDRVGGIIGHMDNCSRINNCYNSGNVSGITASDRVGGISGYILGSNDVGTNNYYKNGTALYGNGSRKNNSGAEPLDDMPSVISVVNNENDGFREDEYGINEGYPLLAWQVE